MKLINPEVRIETTNLCNAKCVMCPRDELTRPKATMSYDHCKELIDQANDLDAELISLFGYGEPLIDTSLGAKIRYCTRLGLRTFITTNASLLSTWRANQLIENGLSMIRFSVHGLTRENYENVHVGLDFHKVMENIENFLNLNIRTSHSVETHLTVLAMNGEDVWDIRNFWEHKIDYLEIWKPHGWAGQKEYRKLNHKKKTCGRPFTGPLQINADGKMMICCFDTDARMTVGDTHQNTIEDIVRGEPYREIRRKHVEGTLTGLPCEKCDQLNEEKESPLLYSNRDKNRKIGRTSSIKFDLEDKGV